MLRSLFFICTLFILTLLTGCQNQEQNTGSSVTPSDSLRAKEFTYTDFGKLFKPAHLPYNLPEAVANDSSKELNSNMVQHFFASVPNRPAFEQKDVPALAANAENARYYAAGMLNINNYSTYIIQKKEEGNYYYLVTFNDKGSPLDIMCIAFEEGSGDNKTQRNAVIDEDYSIQIRQDKLRLYEIAPDGTIHDLRKS